MNKSRQIIKTLFLSLSLLLLLSTSASGLSVESTTHSSYNYDKSSDLSLTLEVSICTYDKKSINAPATPLSEFIVDIQLDEENYQLDWQTKALAQLYDDGAFFAFSRFALRPGRGIPNRNQAFFSQSDPARKVMGPAHTSHVDEIAQMRGNRSQRPDEIYALFCCLVSYE